MAARTSLTEYHGKRNFERTPEPRGGDSPGPPTGDSRFFVQKHAASRLHYDLRLELDGTLKSWAVPKGPSLDPEVRALAVHVEDHPLEYGSFEGVIPQGEYGGGTVLLWDRGQWEPESEPRRGYEKGHLDFRLRGEKLSGRWILVRMRGKAGDDGRNWLLRKVDDDAARPETEWRIQDEAPLSVATGRTLEEIATEEPTAARDGDSGGIRGSAVGGPRGRKEAPADTFRSDALPPAPDGAARTPLPKSLRPQLPTLVKAPPEGDSWLYELKYDGYRILLRLDSGQARVITRGGHDWSDRFPELVHEAQRLAADGTMIDGEVAVQVQDGTTDFQALQNWVEGEPRGRLLYFAFDLPFYRGHDLRALPLLERKQLLREVLSTLPPKGLLRYSDHIRGEGRKVTARACRLALEGVVAKEAGSPYREGRTRSWVKVKCLDRQEFVVGAWTEPSGARHGFGALLVGWHDDGGRLVYAGRVGTGFTDRSLDEISRRMEALATDEIPFDPPPPGRPWKGVNWVQPKLVAEVEFGSRTDDGILRHAAFRGLREDKEPEEIVLETPAEDTLETGAPPSSDPGRVAGVRLSNADRVLYPEQGRTKADLARYMEAVAPWLLPHVRERPLSLVRCPRGRAHTCFYQKHLTEGMPEAVRGIPVEEDDGEALYVGVDDVVGLVTLIQFGVLEIHPWGARADRLDRPDRLIFDLDPGPGVAWKDVVKGAHEIGERLEGLGLRSFVRTTGGKGLHVVAPLTRRSTWDDVKEFARDVATGFQRRDPGRYIATSTKSKREGRIFVDYLRNGRGATAIASYSTRARPGAPVATPIRWDELARLSGPDRYDVSNIPDRVQRLGADPWEGFSEVRQSLTRRMRESAGP